MRSNILIKKLIIGLLILLVVPLRIEASSLGYQENNKTETNLVGVTHIKAKGTTTNDHGVQGTQHVNVFKQGENIELVNWSKTAKGKIVMSDILQIATDFELKNPNFKVIAGVNGDFFWAGETISSNVIYDNRILNPNNHLKYSALKFNLDGQFVSVIKTPIRQRNYFLSAYDSKTNALIYYEQLKGINSYAKAEPETSVIIDVENHIIDETATYFQIVDSTVRVIGDHSLIEGTIGEQITSFTTGPVLMSQNEELIQKFVLKPKIKIQRPLMDFEEGQMLIGFGEEILTDQKIKEFAQMTGQSDPENRSTPPRTGIGYDSSGKAILFTVDGRGAGGSKGVNLREFAAIMKYYGAIDGFNLDGGGSTEAVVRENETLVVANVPSEFPLRKVANGLLFVKRVKPLTVQVEQENQNLTLNLTALDQFEKFEVLADGEKTTYHDFVAKINLELAKKEYVALSVIAYYREDNLLKSSLILNKALKTNYVETIIYPEFTVEHQYLNQELEVLIKYNDPNKVIDSMRVYLEKPELNLPALIYNVSTRRVRFSALEKLEEQEITIIVKYIDNTTTEIKYQITVEKEKTSPLKAIIIAVAAVVGIGALVGAGLIFKKSRKRLH